MGRKANTYELELLRHCNRQTGWNNTPKDPPEIYYRCCVMILFLDELIIINFISIHVFFATQLKALMGMTLSGFSNK